MSFDSGSSAADAPPPPPPPPPEDFSSADSVDEVAQPEPDYEAQPGELSDAFNEAAGDAESGYEAGDLSQTFDEVAQPEPDYQATELPDAFDDAAWEPIDHESSDMFEDALGISDGAPLEVSDAAPGDDGDWTNRTITPDFNEVAPRPSEIPATGGGDDAGELSLADGPPPPTWKPPGF